MRNREESVMLAIVDSTRPLYRYVEQGVLSALEHFGMPFEVIDLAQEELAPARVSSSSVLVIAQEGMGEDFSSSVASGIKRAIEETGTGLVSFDHRLTSYPSVLRNVLAGGDKDISFAQSKGLKIADNGHFITGQYEGDERGEFSQPVEVAIISSEKAAGSPVISGEGHRVLRLSRSGRGRIAQFLISPRMWHSDYFGHCQGFDGVFWRSIVWAARKPFVTRMVPPFVTCRIDDASGSASIFGKKGDSANRRFAYLDLLNRLGLIPNIGLFVDDITEEDARVIKKKYDKHVADFSPHAFSDPENINEHPVYMLHNGKEFSVRELEGRFRRVDEKFKDWGIRQAKTVNAHFCEIGENSLPFLQERGVRFNMSLGVPFGHNWAGAAAGQHPEWNPKPYGNHGFNYDMMPEQPDFFNVVANPLGGHKLKGGEIDAADFLWGNTLFWSESRFNDVEGAAKKGAKIIKLGLDSGFFGCLMTHEQRIATLSIEEFEETLKGIDGLLCNQERRLDSYDRIAEYLYNHSRSRLRKVRISGGRLSCRLSGESDISLELSVFKEGKDEIVRELCDIAPFSGETEIIL